MDTEEDTTQTQPPEKKPSNTLSSREEEDQDSPTTEHCANHTKTDSGISTTSKQCTEFRVELFSWRLWRY